MGSSPHTADFLSQFRFSRGSVPKFALHREHKLSSPPPPKSPILVHETPDASFAKGRQGRDDVVSSPCAGRDMSVVLDSDYENSFQQKKTRIITINSSSDESITPQKNKTYRARRMEVEDEGEEDEGQVVRRKIPPKRPLIVSPASAKSERTAQHKERATSFARSLEQFRYNPTVADSGYHSQGSRESSLESLTMALERATQHYKEGEEEDIGVGRRKLRRKRSLQQEEEEKTSKRGASTPHVIAIDDSDDEVIPVQKHKRRARIYAEDKDEDMGGRESEVKKLETLQQIFPDHKPQALRKTLLEVDGSIEAAANVLSSKTLAPVRRKSHRILDSDSEGEFMRPKSSKARVENGRKQEEFVNLFDGSDLSSASCTGTESEAEDSDEEASEARRVDIETLKVFNESSIQELQDYTSCTEEQAQRLISLRPFDSVGELRGILRKQKGMGERILNAYIEAVEGYSAVDRLIRECEEVGAGMTSILRAWNGLGKKSAEEEEEEEGEEEESGTHLTEVQGECIVEGFIREQPKLVSSGIQLKGYQMLGVNWLLLLYRRELSGILADEMGLGKTAQVISFLGALYEQGERGPHLIVVPSSTLENWLREFEKFCPALAVRSYYGSQSERVYLREEYLRERDYNVIVTTYNLAAGSKEDRSFLRKLKPQTMILDEGHCVKNYASARYEHLMSIKSKFRLLLTGTPLQNNLQELISLLVFVMPNMFSEQSEELRRIFKLRAGASLFSRQRINRAKKMMRPFILRRKKCQVLKDIPPKHERIEYCELTPAQREHYDELVEVTRRELRERREGKVGGITANVLMTLRKAANHPLLFRRLYHDEKLRIMSREIMKEEAYFDANREYIMEDMQVMSDFELHRLCQQFKSIQKFALKADEWMLAGKVQKLQEMLPRLKAQGDRVLIFSQFTMMLDILEPVMRTLGIRYLRMDGSNKVEERQDVIDQFNEDADIVVFLLSTKAGGFGINLTSANVVILYDIDFNPHNDKQAEDRAHRVGQTRDVTVIRMIAKNTIEEQILSAAEAKLKLDRTLSANQDTSDSVVETHILSSLFADN
ncbi:uncharacterized protein VTP21DRAFT_10860 [Calcarisporiella thermophila]|uniref:uncharacterized protein n=1 Tax=Calcarisporiella thermophila TaxID=911321 RepID=UPI003742067F